MIFLQTYLKHYKEFLRKKIPRNSIFRFKFQLVLTNSNFFPSFKNKKQILIFL